MRTVVFDLDGTLADTSGDLIAAANACFRDLGLGDLLDPARDGRTAVKGGRAMLRLGFARSGTHGEDEVEAQYRPLLDYYGQAIAVHSFMYDGAMDAIGRLHDDGYRVAICTNKPEGLAETLMTQLGVRDQFHALVGADTLTVSKPDPAPLFEAVRRAGGDAKMTLLVGDTDTDRQTAAAAGVPSVLVSFGPGGDDMAILKPEAIMHDYADLSDIVKDLIG